jgi:regulatory protein
MVIERLLNKNNSKCLIEISNGETLVISTDLVLEYKLYKGMEIDDRFLESLLKRQSIIDAKQTAYNYVAYKPRTESQVRTKLKEKSFSNEAIDKSIEFLYEFKYLNDEKYALDFVRNYLNLRGAGKIKLAIELKKRGITQDLINNAIQTYFPEDVASLAMETAKYYLKKISYKTIEKQKSSLRNYLLRQGFEYNIINTTMNDIFENSDLID